MAVDFGQQYISFFGLLKHAVLTGDLSSLTYSFTKSLGGDMIGVLGYYLMSPFNIFYILYPLQTLWFSCLSDHLAQIRCNRTFFLSFPD